MSPQEAAALLAVAAAFDNRKPDPDAALAWAHALEGFKPTDCRDAIVKHYRETREWLMPADVVSRVRAVQSERLRSLGEYQPPDGLTDAEYSTWYRDLTHRLANGELVEQAPRQISSTPPLEAKALIDRLRVEAEAAERERAAKHTPTAERAAELDTQEEA